MVKMVVNGIQCTELHRPLHVNGKISTIELYWLVHFANCHITNNALNALEIRCAMH